MKFQNQIKDYLNLLQNAINLLSIEEVDKFLDILLTAYEQDSTIFIFGNGGSASTASHFATDFNKGVSYGLDKRFKVMALTDSISTISAYSNDTSCEDIFVEQMKNFIKDKDVIIGVSGSGNSKNVLKAIEYANARGNITLGITGYNGGILKKIAKYSINANINDMQVSEDIHMIIVHLAMRVFDNFIRNKI